MLQKKLKKIPHKESNKKMTRETITAYILYLLRWQLSTPVLAVCYAYLATYGTIFATIMGNLIGGLLFFWVDKQIFRRKECLKK